MHGRVSLHVKWAKVLRNARVIGAAMIAAGLVLAATNAVVAAAPPPENAQFTYTLLAKAAPDECFDTPGSPNNVYPATPPNPACPTTAPHAKVNQSYVWSLTQTPNKLWFGTSANTLCWVIGGLLDEAGLPLDPIETNSFACEFGSSAFSPPVPTYLGDWRPPQIYVWNQSLQRLINKNPTSGEDLTRLQHTLGLRAAGTLNDVVILAGPALYEPDEVARPEQPSAAGINLFAYQASTGNFLGSTTLTQYGDIRQFAVVNGNLYAAVATSGMEAAGAVLKWAGSVTNPFLFKVVGNLDAEAAYLTGFENRIYVSTWGGALTGGGVTGVWRSPLITSAWGLSTGAANNWREIWKITDYEPDPVTANTILGGAIMAWQGNVYWGTMQVPISGALANIAAYGTPSTVAEAVQTIVNTTRAISIFRCCANGKVTTPYLLYGQQLLPVYIPGTGWQFAQNKMNQEPRFGPSGFGNIFNTYTWSMAKSPSSLFIGTFDWSYVAGSLLEELVSATGLALTTDQNTVIEDVLNTLATLNLGVNYGADLWRFTSPSKPAVAESQYGLGNYLNYGLRTMISPGDGSLFVGTANPFNLITSVPDTSVGPKVPEPFTPTGGWELTHVLPR